MADRKKDSNFIALEAIYAALKDLDNDARKKVLSSALALLGAEGVPSVSGPPPRQSGPQPTASQSRPVSLLELMNEKNPGTNPQRIVLFAYYREKHEGISRFSRDDLKPYFAKAKLTPAANYDRDFGEAVRKAWIHEDGSESYLTTKGIEVVETAFEGERKYSKGAKSKLKKKKQSVARKKQI